MPATLSKWIVLRDSSYCSVPPLTTSSHVLLPPRLSRTEEARRPPLRAIKAEVRESEPESVEFVVDEEDDKRPVKQEVPIKIEPDPRQITARVAALAIRQPTSTASTSSEEAQGPSGIDYRTQPLCHVPSGRLGPADLPRRPGRPKGSKSRPRIPVAFGLPVPPERQAAATAQAEMVLSSKNRS